MTTRATDLMTAFTDPGVRAIVLPLGGATAIGVLDLVDRGVIPDNPKIVGDHG